MPHLSSLTPVPTETMLPFEPYRARTVESICKPMLSERSDALRAAGFDLFRLPSELVAIDLLTDSGTGAMSSAQWAAMMRADESYAGSVSFRRLADAVARITGFANMLPTHQGRIAERLLVDTLIGVVDADHPQPGAGMIVPNNAHFDTTRHMIEASGAEARTLLPRIGLDPCLDAPFKGDIDLAALGQLLNTQGEHVPFVMLTITCNSNGGQPVSLANMRAVRDICDAFSKPLMLDACRFAENACFIQQREAGQSARSVLAIAREMFDLADGVAMSTRKDALCNVGGLLLLRNDHHHHAAAQRCVLTRGFTMNYGSLPARDLEAIAVGMHEAVDDAYLLQRSAMIARMGQTLERHGVRIVKPTGGHAIFIDAAAFCPHLHQDDAAHSLACAIYQHAGVRCTSIGSAMMDQRTGTAPQLVRLAIPRRLYSESHLQYAAAAIGELRENSRHIVARRLESNLSDAQRNTIETTFEPALR